MSLGLFGSLLSVFGSRRTTSTDLLPPTVRDARTPELPSDISNVGIYRGYSGSRPVVARLFGGRDHRVDKLPWWR